MKKVFIVSGELSGEQTAAWYVEHILASGEDVEFYGVGGDNLARVGVKLYERFEKLNVIGIIEIIRHIPFLCRFLNQLLDYILKNGFDEVVFVDFPAFNLRLAKKLKAAHSKLRVIYLAPPQTWCWGAWRIKSLKKYCDKLIVLYPFEVEWYKKHGVVAEWMGNSVYSSLQPYFNLAEEKENLIALIPGSRRSELKRYMPMFFQIIKFFVERYSNVKFVIPVAGSLSVEFLNDQFQKSGLNMFRNRIIFAGKEEEKFSLLSRCCLAITKPGTITLELALLKVPAVVFFKVSWLTYFIGWLLVKVKYMSLPNLLCDYPFYKEFIQKDCRIDLIIKHSNEIYQNFLNKKLEYQFVSQKLVDLRKVFSVNFR